MKKFLNTKLNENKAITLIALVITIVILIILAGVAISLTLGNNGLFTRAKTAKEQYQNAQNEEEMQIAKYSNEIESYVGGGRNIEKALLWINENPNEEIEETSIDLGKSIESYSHLLIQWKYSTTVNTIYEDIYKINPLREGDNVFYSFSVKQNGGSYTRRLWNTDDTTINCSKALKVNTSNNQDKTLALPYAIYGLSLSL